MKISFHEYNEAFSVQLEAENMADAAKLTRFGLNATKERIYMNTQVNSDNTFSAYISLGKRKRRQSTIKGSR
jgi:hypothetical protein